MKIGITCRILTEDGTRKEFVNEAYMELVSKYNFIPIVLSSTTNKLEELMDMCDCFLLPGGDDMDASYFNEKNDSHNFLVDPKIDVLDYKVIKYALEKNKPILKPDAPKDIVKMRDRLWELALAEPEVESIEDFYQ